MIFTSIKLYNFRQYKNEHLFEFSDNKKKNITLIIGDIGSGKTTLLQAFRYCFYGASSNYLNLPRSNELINFNIADTLKELETTKIYVEVEFKHKDVNYIVRREQKYIKKNNKLLINGEEDFSFSESTRNTGYRITRGLEATEKMFRILPPGLSYVFMFDGERVEKNITSNEAKLDLKESVLGILGLKKIDTLIDYLGKPGAITGNNVIKYLNSKNPETSKEDQEIIKKRDFLASSLETYFQERDGLQAKINKAEKELEEISNLQKKFEENAKNIEKRDNLKKDEDEFNRKIDDLSKQYISDSGLSILYKALLLNKEKYDSFILKNDNVNKFYNYLHKDTLDDVLKRGLCICGREVAQHSKEEKTIHSLYSTALPIESSHHLSKISSEFLKSTELNKEIENLDKIKNEITEYKEKLKENSLSLRAINRLISEFEIEHGETTQIIYDTNIKTLKESSTALGKVEENINIATRALQKLSTQVEKIEKKDINFNKVLRIREDLATIYHKLEKMRSKKDENARKILAKHFIENINKILKKFTKDGKVESYDAEIDEKYNLKIINLMSKRDVTDVLSKGQSVIISLSFLKALIDTTKEISEQIDTNQRYGVIMDAALSNLSETAVKQLSETNIVNLDQLIFLSFKKQLRDEMYNTIKNSIGKIYVIERIGSDLNQIEIDFEKLDDYIHESAGK